MPARPSPQLPAPLAPSGSRSRWGGSGADVPPVQGLSVTAGKRSAAQESCRPVQSPALAVPGERGMARHAQGTCRFLFPALLRVLERQRTRTRSAMEKR